MQREVLRVLMVMKEEEEKEDRRRVNLHAGEGKEDGLITQLFIR